MTEETHYHTPEEIERLSALFKRITRSRRAGAEDLHTRLDRTIGEWKDALEGVSSAIIALGTVAYVCDHDEIVDGPSECEGARRVLILDYPETGDDA